MFKPNDPGGLKAHMALEKRARDWAAKSIKLKAAGKLRESKQAEAQAKAWLAKAMQLERMAKPVSPHD